MLPRSTHSRSDRDGRKGPPRGRTLEIQRLIGRSLRAAVDLSKLAGFTIRLDCDVLQADGGTRTTAVSGSFLALSLAIRGLVSENLVPEDVLRANVAAISVGIVDGKVLVDLDYLEDSRAEVDLNLVVEEGDRIVEVQATAERASYSRFELDRMVEAGLATTRGIFQLQRESLRDV
jgi:ribonuclease PH